MSDAGRELSVYEGSYTGSFCCVTAVGVPVIESRVKAFEIANWFIESELEKSVSWAVWGLLS